MYINFWYALELSKNVTAEKPTTARALSQNFALYRDAEGKAHCIHNVCAHRGGSLGDGRVRNGCIECPYHGWQYDGGGDCKQIPSLGPDNQRIPRRTKLDSYPTEEHYGIVFAFLGDLPEAERPPLMLPHSNPEGWTYPADVWRSVTQSWQVETNYERCVENGIDPSHNEYVHPTHGSDGTRGDYGVPDFDLKDHEWGTGFVADFVAKKPKSLGGDDDEQMGAVKAAAGHSGPNSVWTYIAITPEMLAHQYLFETPIENGLTRAFNVGLINFAPPSMDDEMMEEMNARIAGEDVVVLNKLEPVCTPDDRRTEVMMPSDRSIVRYRKYLKEWDKRGWRIDEQAIAASGGRRVFAIPSPRRRDEDGWVFESVPLLAGDE